MKPVMQSIVRAAWLAAVFVLTAAAQAAQARLRLREWIAEQFDAAGGGAQLAGDRVHQSRLASATRPEHGDHVTPSHGEADLIEDGLITAIDPH